MIHGRTSKAISLIAFLFFSATTFAANAPAVPGQFVVKIKQGKLPLAAPGYNKILGGTVKQTISQDLRLVLVERPVVEQSEFSVQALSKNSIVEYAEPNFIYKAISGSPNLPNDPELGKLWGLINTGQNTTGDMGDITGKPGFDIGAQEAWMVETGSQDILVAVIDTGVNHRNLDLMDNMYTNMAELNGKAGVDDDNNGYVDDVHGYDFANKDGDAMDDYGHGTHVSGTIGAIGNNGSGVVGVAWNVKILPIKFLAANGSGTLADAVAAIEYGIKMGAKIMNNSWGGGEFTQSLYDVIAKARDANILFVAAAGNESNNNDTNPAYPASYQIENVVSVAAMNPDGTMASFSNFGTNSVHLGAPGSNILSYGLNGIEAMSGTSMACPHVVGVAALLWSQNINQSFQTIKDRMISGSRPFASLRGRVASGGMVNTFYGLTDQKAPQDPNDPYTWSRHKQSDQVATAHPYSENANQTWTMTVPGATRVSVVFSQFDTEGGYDFVEVSDANGKSFGKMSGNLGQAFSPVVEGDTVILTFTSDKDTNRFGFEVESIAFQ